jgi:hypothetical protein
MAIDPARQARIEQLNAAIRRLHPGYGYSEKRLQGRSVGFTFHGPLGEKQIPVRPGQERAAQDALLTELTNLAHLYNIGPAPDPAAATAPLPRWLCPEARLFCEEILERKRTARGLHRFGRDITVRGAAANEAVQDHRTKEQVVHASATALDMFRYLPPERNRYCGTPEYEAAMECNFSLWHYVEKQGFPPSVARERLIAVNREMHKILIYAFSAIGVSGDSNAPTLPDAQIGQAIGALIPLPR